jgi:NAD(P)-dependent dehydrogenase (short-subunit alcohol dehydrogenase family)
MEGQLVIATARNPAGLVPLRGELERGGHRLETHALDVTDEASIVALRDWVADRFGRLDILINNAGIRPEAALEDLTLQAWRDVMAVSLDGAFLCVSARCGSPRRCCPCFVRARPGGWSISRRRWDRWPAWTPAYPPTACRKSR